MDRPSITVQETVNDLGQRIADLKIEGDGIEYYAHVIDAEPRKPLVFPKTLQMARNSLIKAWVAMKVTGAPSPGAAWDQIHKSKTLLYRYFRELHALKGISA